MILKKTLNAIIALVKKRIGSAISDFKDLNLECVLELRKRLMQVY